MLIRSGLVLSICLILTVSVSAQAKSDLERANMTGLVKRVRERSYRFIGTTDKRKDDTKRELTDTGDTIIYDERGNEIERLLVSDFGEQMGKQTQSFDPPAKLKETVFSDMKGAVLDKTVYFYAGDRVAEILRYNATGKVTEKTKRVFDVNGNMTEEVYLDPKVERAKTVYRYDERGNVVEMAFFLAGGKKAYAPIGPCLGGHRVTTKRDDKGRMISKTLFDLDGKMKKSWAYTWNDRGDLAGQTITSSSSVYRYTYKYEYDSLGNWIKQMAAIDDSDRSNSLFEAIEVMEKGLGKKTSPTDQKDVAETFQRTTVTVREITYY